MKKFWFLIIKPIFSYFLNNELPRFYLSGAIIGILGFILLYVLHDIIGILPLRASVWTDIFCYTLGFFMKKFFVFIKKNDNSAIIVSLVNVIILFVKSVFLFLKEFILFLILTYFYVKLDYRFMSELVIENGMDLYVSKIIIALPMSLLSYFLNKVITFSNPISLFLRLRNYFLAKKIRSYK